MVFSFTITISIETINGIMEEKEKVIEHISALRKGLNLLGRNRKVVLSHHKTFELVDELEERAKEISEILNKE